MRNRPVAGYLGLCASAVKRLAATIDYATQRWQLLQVLEHNSIVASLDDTTEAIAFLNPTSPLGPHQRLVQGHLDAATRLVNAKRDEVEHFHPRRPDLGSDASLSVESLRLASGRKDENFPYGFQRGQQAAQAAPRLPNGSETLTKANELDRMKFQFETRSEGEASDDKIDAQDDAEASASVDRFSIRPAAQKNLGDRAKYQFEADTEDDETENEIEDDL
jgi:hypothetical protein